MGNHAADDFTPRTKCALQLLYRQGGPNAPDPPPPPTRAGSPTLRLPSPQSRESAAIAARMTCASARCFCSLLLLVIASPCTALVVPSSLRILTVQAPSDRLRALETNVLLSTNNKDDDKQTWLDKMPVAYGLAGLDLGFPLAYIGLT